MPAKKGAVKPAAKKAATKVAAKAAAKTTAAPAKAGASNGVYVKNLAFPGISHDTIKQAFKGQGEVKDVVLRRRKYAILYMKDAAAATAVRDLNGKVLKGNKIVAEAAKKSQSADKSTYAKSVFVGNLPSLSHKKGKELLKKEFAKCGSIVKVRTYSAGYGFVYFADNAAAKKAVQTLDHQVWTRFLFPPRHTTLHHHITPHHHTTPHHTTPHHTTPHHTTPHHTTPHHTTPHHHITPHHTTHTTHTGPGRPVPDQPSGDGALLDPLEGG